MKSNNNIVNIIEKIGGDRRLLEKFLVDLLTPTEYREMNKRIDIVRMLNEGMPHKIIAARLKVGVATVTRGSKVLKNPKGGFSLLFKK